MKGLAVFIASFGFVGYFPIAPGTAGSLAALALFALIRWIGVPAVELSAIVAVFAIGVWAAHGTEIALGRKDPRALDVVKPYPAAQLEHLHGGLGIMADDAVAGLYAHLALRACVWMVPAWLTA